MTNSDPREPVTSPESHKNALTYRSPSLPSTRRYPTTLSTYINNSRFEFHSDTRVPPQLSILERETYIRYTAFVSRLNAIDRQVASWTARHANEVVDRGLDVVRLYNWHACDPLERCAKRVLDKLERELGALWESKLEKRGVRDNGTDNSNDDSAVGGDDSDNMDYDDEKNLKRAEDMHQMGASGISEDEAKVDDNGDIFTCFTATEDIINEEDASGTSEGESKIDDNGEILNCITATEEIIDDSHSATQPTTNVKNKPPTIPLSPMKTFDKDMDPAQANIESPKNCRTAISLQSVSEKISNFSANLNTFVHKTIPEQCHKSFDSIHQVQLQADIPHKIHLERTKSTKREGFIVRRFETIAGIGHRALVEENAERIASLTILEEKIANADGMDDDKRNRFLAEIEEIRRMVEQERRERARQDEIVLERLVMTREALQRSLGSGLGLS